MRSGNGRHAHTTRVRQYDKAPAMPLYLSIKLIAHSTQPNPRIVRFSPEKSGHGVGDSVEDVVFAHDDLRTRETPHDAVQNQGTHANHVNSTRVHHWNL